MFQLLRRLTLQEASRLIVLDLRSTVYFLPVQVNRHQYLNRAQSYKKYWEPKNKKTINFCPFVAFHIGRLTICKISSKQKKNRNDGF